MKRKLLPLVIAMLLIVTATSVVWGAPGIVVDGRPVSYAVDPQIKDDRLLVPLYAFARQMGYSLEHNIESNDYIFMPLYDSDMDNEAIASLPITEFNGTLMAPLRFVAEALGASVLWNPVFDVVTVSTSKTIHEVASEVNVTGPDLWIYPNEDKYIGMPGDIVQVPLLVYNDGCSSSTDIVARWDDQPDGAPAFIREDATVPRGSFIELIMPITIQELDRSGNLVVSVNPEGNHPGSEKNLDNNQQVITVKAIDTRDRVALTFDDGPDDTYTDQILDILAEEDVKATFFLLGCNTEYYPEVARRVVEEGHEVGNHSYSHPDFSGLSIESAYNNQIMKTEKIFEETMGVNSVVFRPPYGSITKSQTSYFEDQGFGVIMWDVDTLDWDKRVNTRSYITRCVLNETQDGYIVLMHSGGGDRTNTVASLPDIIQGLKERNYRFCTVTELLEAEAEEAALEYNGDE